MNELLNLVLKRNKNNETLTSRDIIKITNILTQMYEINIEGVDFRTGEVNTIYYSVDNNIIVIDYEKFFKRNLSIYSNYLMLFSLVHEVRHAAQYLSSVSSDDIISRIYLDCFDYISKNTFIAKIFYSRNHDDFPIEINADIVAYIFVIYVAYMLNDNIYFDIFTKMFFKRIKGFSNNSYDVLKSVCGEDIIDYLSGIEDYDLFLNGLLRNNEKAINIGSSLILM